MDQIESGDWFVPAEEVDEYRAAAAHLRDHMEILIDFTRPIPVEHAMYLKFCQIGLQGDLDTRQQALAEFDRLTAQINVKH